MNLFLKTPVVDPEPWYTLWETWAVLPPMGTGT
jgi:hypothetical protein